MVGGLTGWFVQKVHLAQKDTREGWQKMDNIQKKYNLLKVVLGVGWQIVSHKQMTNDNYNSLKRTPGMYGRKWKTFQKFNNSFF